MRLPFLRVLSSVLCTGVARFLTFKCESRHSFIHRVCRLEIPDQALFTARYWFLLHRCFNRLCTCRPAFRQFFQQSYTQADLLMSVGPDRQGLDEREYGCQLLISV